MATFALVPHPDFPSDAATSITVEVTRTAARRLRLHYLVFAGLDGLHLPAVGAPERRDELWRSTCFELFVARPQGYAEYNLSPSTAWAAYDFSGYREGMTLLDTVPPEIDQNRRSDRYELIAGIDLPAAATGAIGLSAVIEARDGSRSYWALAHPAGPPDFHDPATFIAALPRQTG